MSANVQRDWVDEIEAATDSTAPFYLPKLIAEIRKLRVELKEAQETFDAVEFLRGDAQRIADGLRRDPVVSKLTEGRVYGPDDHGSRLIAQTLFDLSKRLEDQVFTTGPAHRVVITEAVATLRKLSSVDLPDPPREAVELLHELQELMRYTRQLHRRLGLPDGDVDVLKAAEISRETRC